jgi:hypothetical protein
MNDAKSEENRYPRGGVNVKRRESTGATFASPGHSLKEPI